MSKYNQLSDNFTPQRLDKNAISAQSYCLQDDGIIFGGSNALFKYDYDTESTRKLKTKGGSKRLYTHILDIGDNKFLLTTRWDGLWIYDYNSQEIKRADFYDEEEIIACLMDSDNNLWISSYGNGIECFDSNYNLKLSLNTSNSELTNDIILSFAENGNEIWIATDGGGINIYNKSTKEITHINNILGDPNSFPVNSVLSLYNDNNGNMWAGTVRAGAICIKDVDMRTFYEVASGSNYGLSKKTVSCLLQDEFKNVWIGTDGGGLNNPPSALANAQMVAAKSVGFILILFLSKVWHSSIFNISSIIIASPLLHAVHLSIILP